jgi:hypothetical protein
MTNKLIESARRAEGSEVLPRVMLGDYRADDLLMKMADALEAAEADAERLAGAVATIDRDHGIECVPDTDLQGALMTALAAHRARKETRHDR